MLSKKPPLQTQFLPPERATKESLMRGFAIIHKIPFIKRVLDTVPDSVLILNKQRQIVFCNKSFLEKLDDDLQHVLGMRPGEALQCIHSDETPGGCGTTDFCRECGAPKAILEAQSGKRGESECRIIRKSGEALDLRVIAEGFEFEGDPYTVFTIADIGNEKRRKALERLFFHDILNTAGNLRGVAELFNEPGLKGKDEIMKLVKTLSDKLIEEIDSHRELTLAENGELKPEPEFFDSVKFLEELTIAYRHHPVAKEKHIRIERKSKAAAVKADRTLLRRVVGNMIKNALEASEEGETVSVSTMSYDGSIDFGVHNSKVMPVSVQRQVFQRSFSTKGADRGLGTYSMKLIIERYMKGAVSFSSRTDEGTRFTVRIPQES